MKIPAFLTITLSVGTYKGLQQSRSSHGSFLLRCLLLVAVLTGTLSACLTGDQGFFSTQEALPPGNLWDRARAVREATWRIDKDPQIMRLTQLVHEDPEPNLPRLVEALVAGRVDDFERAKAIHDWIARTIAYDFAAYAGNTPTVIEPYAVLRRGSTVCAGYAHLFALMCRMADMTAIVVTGYVRDFALDPFVDAVFIPQRSHAWNAVRIEGAWYLVDTTWDAGDAGRGIGDSAAQYSTGYLFTPPDVFLCTHFPEDARWQLLDRPLSAAELDRLPILEGAFATLGFVHDSSLERVAQSSAQAELDFRAPPEWHLEAFLRPVESRMQLLLSNAVTRREGDLVHVLVTFPRPGRYALPLSTFKGDNLLEPVFIGMLYFEATAGTTKRFPRLSDSAASAGFASDEIDGYEGMVGGSATISFSCPGDVKVLFMDAADQVHQDCVDVVRTGDKRSLTVSFPAPGEYTVIIFVPGAGGVESWSEAASFSFSAQAAGSLDRRGTRGTSP